MDIGLESIRTPTLIEEKHELLLAFAEQVVSRIPGSTIPEGASEISVAYDLNDGENIFTFKITMEEVIDTNMPVYTIEHVQIIFAEHEGLGELEDESSENPLLYNSSQYIVCPGDNYAAYHTLDLISGVVIDINDDASDAETDYSEAFTTSEYVGLMLLLESIPKVG